jgi:CsoR family transcriptional regulator, copper-sensing transcriptional repressor
MNKAALTLFSDDLKQNLSDRLKRVEGQVRGVERMLQEDEPCAQILHQIAATQAALHGVTAMVLRNYLEHCVTDAIQSGDGRRKDAMLDELMDVVKKFGR